MMTEPKRIDTHRIDTRAVRTLLQHLPEDWLVRSLEERDYGVDLQIELFSGEAPTGRFAMIQVKGKRDSFGTEDVSLSGFPVKTIEYSLLFSVPFFVFHASVADNRTYFVWLQKYADTMLPKTTPEWRKQGSVTLYFPPTNVLETNTRKIEEILIRHALRKDCFTFIGCCEWLQRNVDGIAHGNKDFIRPALDQLGRIQSLDMEFHERYIETSPDLDLAHLRKSLEALEYIPCDQEELISIHAQLSLLQATKGVILDQDSLDLFAVEVASSDAHPY